jgi:hypothetical protein
MPEKNPRLQKRLERLNRLVDQYTKELLNITVKARRVRGEKDKIKWYHFPTQVIRRDIIRSLILPYEEASQLTRTRNEVKAVFISSRASSRIRASSRVLY